MKRKKIKTIPPNIKESIREILRFLGEDPNREDILKTPERVVKMFLEFTEGYEKKAEDIVKGAIFEEEYDGMVVVKDIEFVSLCEHHLLPFFGKVHVGYIPDKKLIGLSKIPRIVEVFSKKLQVQERLTKEISNFIERVINPKGSGVVIEAVHLCTSIRGVKKKEVKFVTSIMKGIFKEDDDIKEEFLKFINPREIKL